MIQADTGSELLFGRLLPTVDPAALNAFLDYRVTNP
jgi:hypothetical protein